MLALNANFRPACPEDLSAVIALLTETGQPSADVDLSRLILHVAETKHIVVGSAGIEPYGKSGIIRSVVVVPSVRRQRIGTMLVQQAMASAALNGIERLFLLTVDAVEFWTYQGFARAQRDTAPANIRASAEFSTLCPSGAVCMMRSLS
jgi:amino-acid N-acetyltransferase